MEGEPNPGRDSRCTSMLGSSVLVGDCALGHQCKIASEVAVGVWTYCAPNQAAYDLP